MLRMRFAIFLMVAFSVLLLGTAAAQGPMGGDAGQYLILNAQYGSERSHVDVTERLKMLARQDRPFRISDESMATDPDRGTAKALRVFARGPNGRERMFEFVDGSVFDGAMFRSWGRGDWGDAHWKGGWNGGGGNDSGEYVILTAQYGSERRHVDVTNQLKEMARRDVTFQLDYRTFGVDPDEGNAKSLRIFARDTNGQEQMFEYRDNSVIDGAIFRGWRGGDWGRGGWSGNWNGGGNGGGNVGGAGQYVILTAQYGSERRHVDVTNQLKEMARRDVTFQLDYRTFGVDPDEGNAKSLRIFARDTNGQEQMLEYRDNSVIDGAIFRGWRGGDWGRGGWSGNWNGGGNGGDAGQYVILSAQYGSHRRHVDVTNRLKELARRDRQFRMDYRTFGVDPDEGHAKVLRIFARGPNGRERMFEYRDGSVIDGAMFQGWGRGEWGNGKDRWSGRWEGEEREERERDR